MKSVYVTTLLGALCLSVPLACSSSNPTNAQLAAEGHVSLPLTATAADGSQYRLAGTFEIIGPQVLTLYATTDPAEALLEADLQTGDYLITLAEGWTLQKLLDGTWTSVEANLVSDNPAATTITTGTTTVVSFDFETEDEIIAFDQGQLQVEMSVQNAVTYNCDIPPAGQGGQPRPSGTSANLRVLDWAGFSSAVSYTFDDTNSSQIAHYQEMNSWGARYTFYLQTNKSEINDPVWQMALEDGHELGNHTNSHTCGEVDIAQGAFNIQQLFGITPLTLAAPNGDSACQVAASDYLLIRSVNGGTIAPNDNTNPSWLPSNIPGGLGTTEGEWQIYTIHGFTGGTDGAYQPIDFNAFEAAVAQAISSGAWVDSAINIGAYWLGQKAFPTDGTTEWSWELPANFPPNKCLRVLVDGGTLSQGDGPLAWDDHGYFEISLDAGSLSWSPN